MRGFWRWEVFFQLLMSSRVGLKKRDFTMAVFRYFVAHLRARSSIVPSEIQLAGKINTDVYPAILYCQSSATEDWQNVSLGVYESCHIAATQLVKRFPEHIKSHCPFELTADILRCATHHRRPVLHARSRCDLRRSRSLTVLAILRSTLLSSLAGFVNAS